MNRTGTYVAFDGLGETNPAKSDFRYYATLQAWTANKNIESEEVVVKETFIPNAQMAMSSPDYLVTAGDVYTLAFAMGTTPVSYTMTVDSSYKIRVANLGIVN